MSSETISQSLKKAIKAYPGNQHALAAASGVDAAVISRFMNGHRSLTLRSADALGVVLGLELKAARPARRRRKAKKKKE